jgi:hypothetical protein
MHELQPRMALPRSNWSANSPAPSCGLSHLEELALFCRDRGGLLPRSRARAHGPEPGRRGGFGLDLALLTPVKVAAGFGKAQ